MIGGTASMFRATSKTSQGRDLFTNLLARRELYGVTPQGLDGAFSMTTTGVLSGNCARKQPDVKSEMDAMLSVRGLGN
jgi:hypothetical protein